MTIIAKIGILTAWWLAGTLKKSITTSSIVSKAKQYAGTINKPILNLGCGYNAFGDVNADISYKPVKNFMLIDANKRLPFVDKQFAVCICTHLIEHLDNPEYSLEEMHRVADIVYCSFPEWWQLGTYLTPDHKWLVKQDPDSPHGVKFVGYNPVPAILLTSGFILIHNISIMQDKP